MKFKMHISLLVVFVLIFGAVFTASAKGNESGKLNNYTGEEIFTGVIFGQGRVAQLFPEFWTKETLKLANEREAIMFSSNLIAKIKEYNSKYFDELKAAFDSGSHTAVDAAFAKGAGYLQQALNDLDIPVDVDTDPITGQAALVFAGAAVVIVAGAVYMHAVVAHTAVGAAAVVLAVGFWVWPSAKSDVTQLEKDIFIDNAINRLSPIH